MSKFTICFVNKIYPIGGSGTFIQNFKNYLKKKKHIILELKKKNIDYIFITGSNFRNVIPIIYKKLFGSKIINRVDGKNWTYKYKSSSKLKYIHSYLQNLNVLFFQLISDKIIYQSNYVKKTWQKKNLQKKSVTIYNASFPNFKKRNFDKRIKPILISVEGSINSAFNSEKLIECIGENYRYEIYGKVSKDFKRYFYRKKNITFHGEVSRNQIKKILKKSKKYIFISLEMYPACPNSVIEAINHGIPVIGYNQGSMREIIKNEHGKLLNVDSNFNFSKSKLLQAIEQINVNYKKYNLKLKYIDKKFKLNYMLKKYESEINKT